MSVLDYSERFEKSFGSQSHVPDGPYTIQSFKKIWDGPNGLGGSDSGSTDPF